MAYKDKNKQREYDKQRARVYKQKLVESGYKQITVRLDAMTYDRLIRLTVDQNISQTFLIKKLINSA